MNRDRLMEASVPGRTEDVFDSKPSAIVALINLFVSKEESARLEEARTDEILDGKPPGQSDVPPASTGNNISSLRDLKKPSNFCLLSFT